MHRSQKYVGYSHDIDSDTYTKSDSKNPRTHDDNKRALRMNKTYLQLTNNTIVQLQSPEGHLSNVNEALFLRVVSSLPPVTENSTREKVFF